MQVEKWGLSFKDIFPPQLCDFVTFSAGAKGQETSFQQLTLLSGCFPKPLVFSK